MIRSNEFEYLPPPSAGRTYVSSYRVRLGDAAPGRRLRLDAIARILQDVAEDDASDVGWPKSSGWLLRRCAITVKQYPRLSENLWVETFCSASAPKWAERTTTITGEGGSSVQASAVWVSVSITTGRPTRLDDLFERVYVPSAGGRRASIRLSLPPPAAATRTAARDWPLRSTDFDVWGHVNNAISWAGVEEVIDSFDWLPGRVELEHNQAITKGEDTALAFEETPSGADLWLLSGDRVMTSARAYR